MVRVHVKVVCAAALALAASATTVVGLTPSAFASALPAIAAVSPNSGSTSGGTVVTVSGSGFTARMAVYFGWTPARSVRVLSATRLQAVAPAHGAGTVDVRVHTAAGYALGTTRDRFSYGPLPTVSGLYPNVGPTGGGTNVEMWGNNFVGVSAVTFGGVKGTNLKVTNSGFLTVTAPGHLAGTVPLRVISKYGTTTPGGSSSYRYSAPSAMSWSAPVTIDKAHGLPLSLSCPSTQFCGLVDETGNAITYNGTSWSAPSVVLPGGGLRKVSCAAPTFCMAVGLSSGSSSFEESTYNGTSWAQPTAVDTGQTVQDVSCPTATFCVAVDSTGILTYDGSVWGARSSLLSGPGALSVVSCASASFCMVTDGGANVFTYDGAGWSAAAPVHTASSPQFIGLSCPTTSFCAGVDTAGNASTYDGSSWHTSSVEPGQVLLGVTCTSATFCLASDTAGAELTYDGTTWSAPSTVFSEAHGGPAVSCANAGFCAAVNELGTAATFNGMTWSAGVPIDLVDDGALAAISCPTSEFCAAADGSGDVIMFNGSTWTAPQKIDSTGQPATRVNFAASAFVGISCPSAAFCAALDRNGNVVIYDGTTWGSPTPVDSPMYQSGSAISCPSANFCVVVDSAGRAVTYDGTSWSAPVVIDSSGRPDGLSCPTTTFCLAVDSNGRYITYSSGTWTLSASAVSPWFNGVSCASPTFCIGVVGSTVSEFNGSTWSAGTTVAASGPGSPSCTAASFCAVTAGGGVATLDNGVWSSPAVTSAQSLSCASATFCAAIEPNGSISLGS